MPFPLPTVPFYFLRHGVTDHNLRRLVMGRLDIPLNGQGRRQAESAASQLEQAGIRRILSSPLSRALETARIVANRLRLDITIVDDLQERDWGQMTGRPHRELLRDHYAAPIDAESAADFTARILSAVTASMAATDDAGPLLMVAHSGACRVLRRHLLIDDGEGPVPNAVPLLFRPDATGRWAEHPITSPSP